MKPIAENTYDFAELRETGAVYVDKTGMLRDLIAYPGRKLCFIARSRRFDFSGVKTGSIEEFKEDFAAKVADVIREAG